MAENFEINSHIPSCPAKPSAKHGRDPLDSSCTLIITCDKFSEKNINLTNLDLNLSLPVYINLNLQENSKLFFKLELEEKKQENINHEINIIININLYNSSSLEGFIFSSLSNININININLIEENSTCDLKILSFSDINNSCSINTNQNHLDKNTKSYLRVKRILNSGSTSNYSGRILINNLATNSDALQQDITFILGNNIKNLSIPALEIKNNNVKCAHSFATYKIDDLQFFYLKSRGFSITQAKKIALNAFLEDFLNLKSFKLETIKNKINLLLQNFLT